MSADAFGAFEDAGLDDDAAVAATGRRFRETVLARGGGECTPPLPAPPSPHPAAFSPERLSLGDEADEPPPLSRLDSLSLRPLPQGEHPSDVFRAFRGRDPTPDALLRHTGLAAEDAA